MSGLTYEIVQHDGGWAYKVGTVFSETFPSHDHALAAAKDAAARQSLAGETDGITYQDQDGAWHEEVADGRDRPETEVVDQPPGGRS
ncbi:MULTISPECIES: DUF2188 domain-containing protein [unclassified Aureimonas]|uniref:DUF2188 domain-containing protein n=1 Tax=unclassified Aureimonas TaxID=2615206 RepID=UPI0006F66385|nr:MULTISPECIES: DUF2188 domain-containing protein [unclassified Aureimonas]KQT60691.1 hypothetical protein ASG54_24870 [Aureimonas sp. Leaf460]KQT68820.1 hypothetical protein ASG62_18390 [Aureimonas sp. Leaf427]